MKVIIAAAAAALALSATPSGLVGLAETPRVETAQKAKSAGPKPKRKGPPDGYVRKTLPNAGWKRTTGGGRGWVPARKIAADPVPMTRQVRRAKERRAHKMPLGMKQADWHRANGFAVSRRMAARRRS